MRGRSLVDICDVDTETVLGMYISIFRDKNMPPTEATNMSQDAKLFRRGGAEFADYWEACKKRQRELVIARRKPLKGGRCRNSRQMLTQVCNIPAKEF